MGSVVPSHTRIAIGQTFGRLAVLARAPDYVSPAGYRKSAWRCRCDCGGEITTLGGRLSAGDVRSCGCLGVDSARSRRVDIGGQRFGPLVAVEQLPAGPGRTTLWRFQCDCGALVAAQPSNVKRSGKRGCTHGWADVLRARHG